LGASLTSGHFHVEPATLFKQVELIERNFHVRSCLAISVKRAPLLNMPKLPYIEKLCIGNCKTAYGNIFELAPLLYHVTVTTILVKVSNAQMAP
jgi:hypothetical protein